MGVTIDPSGTADKGTEPIGYADLGNAIKQLKGQFSGFGGTMLWEFAYDNKGVWANGIASALAPQVAQGLGNYYAPPYINGSYY